MSAQDEQSANIPLYHDGELTGQDLEDFLKHLAGCPDCELQLEEEQSLSNLLRRSRLLYAAPEALRSRVVAAVARQAEILDPLHSRVLHFLSLPLRAAQRSTFRWAALAAMVFAVTLGLLLVPRVVRHADAAAFIDTAVTAHGSYQKNQLPLDIRSDSPEAVTAWLAGKVPFQFRLPAPQSPPGGHPAYTLTGARLVSYKNENAALVAYQMKAETISLLVASNKTAVAAGGNEIRSGGLTFHDITKAGLNVITWSNHGVTYALVSSLHSCAQHSCRVCHQNLTDKNDFR